MIVAYAGGHHFFVYPKGGGHHFFSFDKGGSCVFVRCLAGSYRPPPVEIMNGPLGRKLRKFTQLKRNKRFDNFIMLVWVQGSPFHIAAGSYPVQEAWGSQDSSKRGQIVKLLQCC